MCEIRLQAARSPRIPVLLMALAAAGCSGRSPTSPSGLPGTSSSVARLTVTGNTEFTAIGQTSQLIATAEFVDGTTRVVTGEAGWRSSDAALVAVSPAGLITAAGFGEAVVYASFGSRSATRQVSTWPPGTFSVSGRVRVPGQSGLSDVRVFDPASGSTTMTDRLGEFYLAGVNGPQITFERDGHETAREEVSARAHLDVPMQRLIRVAAGEAAEPLPLAPHDVSVAIGADRCYPCRLVRVVAGRAGTLQLDATWSEPRALVNIWVSGRRFTGTAADVSGAIAVPAGEVLVYVGLAVPIPDGFRYYVPFTLSTSLR